VWVEDLANAMQLIVVCGIRDLQIITIYLVASELSCSLQLPLMSFELDYVVIVESSIHVLLTTDVI
jgi:hypothetical protein